MPLKILNKHLEILLVLFGLIFTFLFSIYLSVGNISHLGFYSILFEPLLYSADGIPTLAGIKNIASNNIFDLYNIPELGYPFHSYQYDFPGYVEYAHILNIKFLSFFTNNLVTIFNIYFLLGFIICFGVTYKILRLLDFDPLYSFVISLIYTFSPFHFERIMHTSYTYYFIAPFIFYIALKIYKTSFSDQGAKLTFYEKLALIFFGMFGLYYVVFSLIILSVLFIALLSNPTFKKVNIKATLIAIAMLIAGLAISMSPSVIKKINNPNSFPSLVKRQAYESEIAGFKFMQLISPRLDHRVNSLANFTQSYIDKSPLINENISASLGLFGALGLIISFYYIFIAMAGGVKKEKDSTTISFLSLCTITLFMFGTIGGFGSLVAYIITPIIRSWNRISIFIEFSSLLIFFIYIRSIFKKYKVNSFYTRIFLCLLLLIGLYDQTNFLDSYKGRISQCIKSCSKEENKKYLSDKDFFGKVEGSLPKGAAIYVFPYMGFPEVPGKFGLETYDLIRGYVNSDYLRFNYGGVRSRPGDDFYQALSNEPLKKQIDVAKKLGFQGFYIDTRGYADAGKYLINELHTKFNLNPIIKSPDDTLFFYKLENSEQVLDKEIDLRAAELKSNYFIKPVQNIDFSTCHLGFKKNLVKNCPLDSINGLSDIESWGAWSNGSHVEVKFTQNLPKHFIISFNIQPTKPNIDKNLKLIIGKKTYLFELKEGMQNYHQEIKFNDSNTNKIEFIPFKPSQPKNYELNNNDDRWLAVGFESISIEKIND
jgi:phosphoglycerol transferase